MAAMMIVMVLMMLGPYHGFMGPHYPIPPTADAPQVQTEPTGKPGSIETPEL